MTTLLHVSASPRRQDSESLALAETFLESARRAEPGLAVDHWDLWDGTLPPFGPEAVAAKMAVFAGADPEGDAAVAWRRAREAFERFAAADAYLFSVPMWNHTVPYILKQLIDVVSQPGMVFGFDPDEGYTGLLTGRRAAVLYTGAVWGPGRPPAFGEDHLSGYFEGWLRWAGITDIDRVSFQPNLATADAAGAREVAHRQAAELGGGFVASRAA
ncbi:MAG: NAD(P)H-dependent oxidoreductase [Nocardioidaceae bacterium]|nr:NAD(P)H-dependent oxidoreductase [Nocardioidaceae bacterium]